MKINDSRLSLKLWCSVFVVVFWVTRQNISEGETGFCDHLWLSDIFVPTVTQKQVNVQGNNRKRNALLERSMNEQVIGTSINRNTNLTTAHCMIAAKFNYYNKLSVQKVKYPLPPPPMTQ